MDPVYGYESVNVEAQSRSPWSLLNWTRRLIATRSKYKAFGRGTVTFLEPGNRKVLAFLREHDGEAILCVANLSRVPQAVELDLARFEKRVPVELFGQEPFPPVGKLPYLLTLSAHGYLAFRLATDVKPPGWHEERLLRRRLPVLVLAPGWQQALDRGSPEPGAVLMNVSREKLREEVMLPYLRERRWFAAKHEKIDDVRMTMFAPWKTPAGTWHVSFVDARLANGSVQRYFLPLALDWERRDFDPAEKYATHAIAKVRHKDRVGLFYAAFANPEFPRDLAKAMGEGRVVKLGAGELRFTSTALFAANAPAIDDEVKVPALEQTNTAVFFGNRLFLKGYRRVREGVNPELEVGRFLTEVSPFPHIAPILGAVEYAEGDEEPVTLAVLQKFVENQGDLWTLTCQHLARLVARPQKPTGTARPAAETVAAAFHLGRMAHLGRRVAEMHRALCASTGDPRFDPEPVTAADLAAWKERVLREIELTFRALQDDEANLTPEVRAQVAAARRAPRGPREARARHRGEARGAGEDAFPRGSAPGTGPRGAGRLHHRRLSRASPGAPSPSAARNRACCAMSPACCAPSAMPRTPRSCGATRRPSFPRRARASSPPGRRTRRTISSRATRGPPRACLPCPPTGSSLGALLDLFLIEKALYELRYEIANRPDWVAIPLRGLLELSKQ
jgi:maltose alpha-D-glucosyltransferase/alpha-amylase